MTRAAGTWRVGDATITRIDELTLKAFPFEALFPEGDPDTVARHGAELGPGSYDAANGLFVQSIHTWLVRTPHHVILIDTATGNDKPRPQAPPLDHLNEPYLARLAAAGVQPEEVDHVLLTHLHADHVGWNTRLDEGGRWVPTFPNATYLMSAGERAYNESLADGRTPEGRARPDPALGPAAREPSAGVYDDSVRPVIDRGIARFVPVDGSEVLDGLSFLPSPGHSIDHASIRLVSAGAEALFAGDVMHHPLQVAAPELNSCFCEFPEAALRSRAWALAYAADRDVTVFSTHFAESSAGRVRRAGERFAWQFL
ncbi:MBL fold metallo-hydrolase [Chelatococcus reniformis]|uniref:MBL fold metallo-hydrolase n=1 Tax=Chelatococcus reniformis TaxID=1494448 RepID=A0A916X7Z7_9HYPH|nr:MBL fold metallo-hydrolase [Chelatococcus reniformis]GGC48096.1 MBL fold metallo-hydrolase [Chelatococcus reniformis]